MNCYVGPGKVVRDSKGQLGTLLMCASTMRNFSP